MRYEKGHKELSRQRIIDVAAKRFRKEGVAAVGLAGVMTDAGLTNGAFYAHFDSKEALVRDVLDATLDQRRDNIELAIAAGKPGLQAAIRNYLGASHRDKPALGCPSASLLPEISRHPRPTRVLYTGKLEQYIELIAGQFTAPSAEQRQQQATALFGLLIGCLQMARAVSDKALSDSILAGGIAAGLAILDQALPD